jgi:two-component system alkaline phosphatase synthesis response regulator PhoP
MATAHILLVEDEPLMADLVRLNLEHADLSVEHAATGPDALSALRRARFDLVVLDLMLPGIDGFEVAREARARGFIAPILMLTARGETAAKVTGLDAGADDYLVKPFAMPELLARVRALLRRTVALRGPTALVQIGACSANLDTREATTHEGRVTLTDTECALLAYFAQNEGQLLTRADILEHAWGMDRSPTARTVDNYVLRLRKLFEPEPEEPRYILTVRGTGYRFVRA